MKTTTSSKNRRATAGKPWVTGKTARRRPKRRQALRFDEVIGKTVEFIEMGTDAHFPCVEIAFDDKTALVVVMNTRLSMEPTYSDWKTGNQRLLRQWPAVDCQ